MTFLPISIRRIHFDFKGCWVVIYNFIQILKAHSVSKQWRTWSDTTFWAFWSTRFCLPMSHKMDVMLICVMSNRLGPEVIKLVSCLTQLSMKFQLLVKLKYWQMEKFLALSLSDVVFVMLINVKMPTMVGILHFNIYEQDNFLLSWVEHEKKFNNFCQSGPVFLLQCISNMSLKWMVSRVLQDAISCVLYA